MDMEAGEMKRWYCLATGLRLVLVAYAEWRDQTSVLKFTDVDYYVFNDAASFVTEGQSPYSRTTFRYTPLLAWALAPNIWVSSVFGKLLFIAFDILTGHLIYLSVKEASHSHKSASMAALTWLLNPLPMTISSRGNAESIMSCLVLLVIVLLQRGALASAGIVYALAVHVKIYPLTYAPAVYMFLGKESHTLNMKQKRVTEIRSFSQTVTTFMWSLRPTWSHVKFCGTAGITLGFLTLFFYAMYGWSFLYETYLYHIVRKDIRHNFSPYFYLLYLTSDQEETEYFIKFLVFLPQLILLLSIAVRFHEDMALCSFLCTFSFVMLNKVCTSQYFLWYLCLLPLLVPRLQISWAKGIFTALLWFTAQGLWLLPAYMLEFEGQNTFLHIWLAGLFFYLVNIYVIFLIITHCKVDSNGLFTKTE